MTEFLIPLLVISFLILVNGVFVAAEFAIVSVPYARIVRRSEEGSRLADMILPILRDPDKRNNYIATAQIGITIASLGLGMYGESTIASWLLEPLEHLGGFSEAAAHTIAFIVAVTVLTYLHVVFGEMIPKSLAIQSAEKTVLQLAAPMSTIGKIFRPLIVVLNGLGNAITRMLGIPPVEAHERLYSAEELEFIMEESTSGGLLAPDEQLYLENIFDFSERDIAQVMTPRNRIVGIPSDANEAEIMTIIIASQFTRFPIYDGDMDSVVGVLHVKDVARYQVGVEAELDLHRLARPVLFVPESLHLQQMLVLFRKEGQHMAIVVDEFGGSAGLVTIEDLVEEVVGEIDDVEDTDAPPMEDLGKGLVRVRGNLILEELNQHYDLRLQHRDVDTVGGLIMTTIGRIPKVGDKITVDGVQFEVESMEGMAVGVALVQLPNIPHTE